MSSKLDFQTIQNNQSQKHFVGEDNFKALAAAYRPQFQLGLLGWINQKDSINNLKTMASVAELFEQSSKELSVHQLWWVVGGVIEALIDGGLESSLVIKSLVGKADREIRRLINEEEAVYAKKPPTELINTLLYYIARSKTFGPRVEAIRSAFNLNRIIASNIEIEALENKTLDQSILAANYNDDSSDSLIIPEPEGLSELVRELTKEPPSKEVSQSPNSVLESLISVSNNRTSTTDKLGSNNQSINQILISIQLKLKEVFTGVKTLDQKLQKIEDSLGKAEELDSNLLDIDNDNYQIISCSKIKELSKELQDISKEILLYEKRLNNSLEKLETSINDVHITKKELKDT
ncbi:MAG: hypothetical protein VYA80_03790 [Pseudomonadota bacterium]|nr:hypothetical protein [Pseudomonadota bacterium]